MMRLQLKGKLVENIASFSLKAKSIVGQNLKGIEKNNENGKNNLKSEDENDKNDDQ